MTLWEDITPYLDSDTGLLMAPDGGKDNLILYSAYLWRELERIGESRSDLNLSIAEFYNSTEVMPGLWLRRAGEFTQNSVDNLIGACYLNQSKAFDVRLRWEEYWSCFDISAPTSVALNSNFYGRFIGLKAFVWSAAGFKPPLIQRLLWCASVMFSVHFSSGASDPLLMSLQVDLMEKHCPRTAAYWKRHFDIGNLYDQYFGKDFPLTKVRRNKYE